MPQDKAQEKEAKLRAQLDEAMKGLSLAQWGEVLRENQVSNLGEHYLKMTDEMAQLEKLTVQGAAEFKHGGRVSDHTEEQTRTAAERQQKELALSEKSKENYKSHTAILTQMFKDGVIDQATFDAGKRENGAHDDKDVSKVKKIIDKIEAVSHDFDAAESIQQLMKHPAVKAGKTTSLQK